MLEPTHHERSVRIIMPLFVSFLMLLVFCSMAQAQDPNSRGRALLKQYCASCHAIGKTGASAHSGAPPFRQLGRSYDLDKIPDQLQRGILSGHPDMPTVRFKPRDARAARSYLRSIQE